MSAANTIELESVLTMSTASFLRSMEEAEAKGKKVAKSLDKGFAGLGDNLGKAGAALGISLSAGAVVSFTKSVIDLGGELADSADRLNINVESLQGLTFAFGQSGAGAEDFQKSFVKLNQSLDEARDGNEKLIEDFRRLQVTLKQVEEGSPEDVLYLIADGLKNAKDPTEALSAALDILGKSGIKLIPGLKGGADAIRELRDEASKLSENEVGQLDEVGDSLDRLATRAKVAGAQVFLGLKRLLANPFPGLNFYDEKLPVATGSTKDPAPPPPEVFDETPRSPRGRKLLKEEQDIIDETNRTEKETADFQDEHLKQQQADWMEIQRINEEIFYTNRDTARIGMDSAERVADLEKERAYWLGEAVRFEKDIFNLHEKDAANARLRAAKIQQQINEAPRDIPEQRFTNSPRGRKMSAEEDAMTTLEQQFGAFKNFKTGPFSSKGGLVTGGLTSGGLDSGGLGDAYHRIRSGDAAQAKAAAEAAKKVKGPEDATAQNTAALLEVWGGKGVRP